MKRMSRLIILLLVSVMAAGLPAEAAEIFEPEVGQEGKDVIWVPTPQALVEKMLDVAKVTPRDFVIDLGSGDGRTVIAAAIRGAKALGIEYNPDMVELSKRNAARAGVSDKASFVNADLFESDFSQAQVITMFLLPDINIRLRPKILDLRPGTRIVSNSFTMGEWSADETVTVKGDCVSYCTAYLWIVPAKADGRWRLGDGELMLKQSFQKFTGSWRRGEKNTPIADARLNADQISFSIGATRYQGRVSGDSMEGTISGGGQWKATRLSK